MKPLVIQNLGPTQTQWVHLHLFFRSVLSALVAIPFGAAASDVVIAREQTIQLRKGWNAVFLEVEPLEHDPVRCFAGTPIEVAAGFFEQTHPAAYVRNPGDAPWREEGWAVWYAPSRPEAVVSSLKAVSGCQAWLIQSSSDFVWKVRGRVSVRVIRWQPESYNFTGFQVDPAAPPTFEKYFAPSNAHRGQKVYRLVDGAWSPVRELGRETMRSGEAYWVYCAGGSDYQGPLRLRVSGSPLDFGRVARDARVELVNASPNPMRLVVESMGEASSLPLAYIQQDLSTLQQTFPSLPSRLTLPDLEGGGSHFLRLAPRREAMVESTQSGLLRISNGEGVQVWLPIVAERSL